jgi:hypothetical protein
VVEGAWGVVEGAVVGIIMGGISVVGSAVVEGGVVEIAAGELSAVGLSAAELPTVEVSIAEIVVVSTVFDVPGGEKIGIATESVVVTESVVATESVVGTAELEDSVANDTDGDGATVDWGSIEVNGTEFGAGNPGKPPPPGNCGGIVLLDSGGERKGG